MIPQFIDNPESMIKFRGITLRDQSERTVTTFYKTGMRQIEISKEVKALVDINLEKELHAIYNPLVPIGEVILYLQTGKYNHLENNIHPGYSTPFIELDIPANSVAFKWN